MDAESVKGILGTGLIFLFSQDILHVVSPWKVCLEDELKLPVTLICDLNPMLLAVGEYRIHNADITFRCDATADQLIDVIEGNRVYIPAVYVLNKIDQISIEVCLSFDWLLLCSNADATALIQWTVAAAEPVS